MKKQSNTLFATISKAALSGLTKQVKETLALGFDVQHRKSFTSADLWNIHRQRKNMVQRRFIF